MLFFILTGLGLYVDNTGRRTREEELMFPSRPLAVSISMPFLVIFTETHINLFDIKNATWAQTINLKGVGIFISVFVQAIN